MHALDCGVSGFRLGGAMCISTAVKDCVGWKVTNSAHAACTQKCTKELCQRELISLLQERTNACTAEWLLASLGLATAIGMKIRDIMNGIKREKPLLMSDLR